MTFVGCRCPFAASRTAFHLKSLCFVSVCAILVLSGLRRLTLVVQLCAKFDLSPAPTECSGVRLVLRTRPRPRRPLSCANRHDSAQLAFNSVTSLARRATSISWYITVIWTRIWRPPVVLVCLEGHRSSTAGTQCSLIVQHFTSLGGQVRGFRTACFFIGSFICLQSSIVALHL